MDQDSEPDVIPSHGRRTFLKRAAVGGAVVWATPAILSVASAGAAASPLTTCTTCAASSYNVLVTGKVANLTVTAPATLSSPPDGTLASLTTTVINTGVLAVSSGQAGGVCSASATLNGTQILGTVISTGVLSSSISWPCACGAPTVATNVATLTVLGAAQTVTGIVNQHITVSTGTPFAGTTVDIIANEQFCNGGVLTANALEIHVTVTLLGATVTDVTIILGHSQVNNGCACPVGFPIAP